MKKTLWIYGDSFGVDWKVEWGWQRLLANKLADDYFPNLRVVNNCCSGSANEWGAKLFKNDKQEKGDIVIFFLTDTARQWFWNDKPYLSNLTNILKTQDAKELEQADKDKYDAAMGYWLHLQRDDIDQLRFDHMLDSIRVQMIERELHLQVIPSFNLNINWTDLVPCHGSMTFSVGDAEFTDRSEMEKWYDQSIDTRANHMLQINHSVFADKLYRRFTKNESLNLETEFKTGFLRHTDKITHPGLCDELIEMAKAPGNTIPI